LNGAGAGSPKGAGQGNAGGESPKGAALEAAAHLLPPARPASRPFPWRTLLIFLVPAAALAAGTVLQRVFEGLNPAGDALLRWLGWSCGAGVLVGLVVGLARRKRLAWTIYGAVAPWAAAALVVGGVRAAKPVRELVADRRETACRDGGRTVCSVEEFRSRCARGDAAALGTPRSKTCAISSCTSRWLYSGPFRPDNHVAPGSLLCSMVVDNQGKLARASLLPGEDVE
jgi:hypothetical protein